jgi:hypothetical protein
VVPNLNEEGSSSVHTGAGEVANVAVQQVCPATSQTMTRATTSGRTKRSPPGRASQANRR